MSEKRCIRGGHVFFSDQKIFKKKDILISNGKIAAIGDGIELDPETQVFDATGKIITPGLIDFHMHAFRYGHLLSIDTEELAPRSGTTTFVDGGSSGSLNFLAFREYVIKPSSVNIFAFLNVSAIGQATDGIVGLNFHDNDDDRLFHPTSAEEVIEKNREIIVGIKARAYTGLKSLTALEKARTLADSVHLPIMVHIAPPPPKISDVLSYLKEGDIITHPFHGGAETILDHQNRVRKEFWEAKERGIEIDLGLDRFHGDLRIMKASLDQGFIPDYISTDLATPNLHHIVYDLPTTISKFLGMGMSLEDTLSRCTYAPAVKMKKDAKIGGIRVGLDADLAILERRKENTIFEDYFGNRLEAKERIVPCCTIRRGTILEPNQRRTDSLDCVFKGTDAWHFGKR